jgi:serine/threonine protein kinase/Tol biopolymer transport system component
LPLASGTRLGPYQVVSQIGAGGMGEVYKAADTRLGRTVAIKVLPDHLAGDPDRLARFRREAQTISSLNHPHICALHDVGDERGTYFLVMEYVEGETLEQRIMTGPISVDDALEYARQIADALHAAHDHGIVHRDLKPGNVMITATGVKLLDFGLAKFSDETIVTANVSQLPTQGAERTMTVAGTILGTVRYMAPEQLEGKEADARTDLYALCLVLYEMVTGRSAFTGSSQASLIAAILKDRPRPLTDFQPIAPPQLDRVVQTGLDKDPKKRWQSARELTHALDWIRSEPRVAVASSATAPVARMWKGLAAVLAVGLAASLLLPRPSRVAPERRLEISTGPTSDPTGFAVSPDGQRITYVASGPAGTMLWLRSLDADRAEPIAQTLGASHPFWSPDSQSIGFFAEGQLKRVDLVSGVTTSLAKAPAPYGGTWGADVILYTPTIGSTVLRIPGRGGEPPTPAVSQPQGIGANLFPVFVGQGPSFLFQPISSAEIHLATLGATNAERLLPDALGAAWHPSGYLLFARQGALLAQRFDTDARKMVGNEVFVADQVLTSNFGVGTGLSVSTSGIVAYRRGRTTRQLAWFDRSGRQVNQAGLETSDLRWPAISASGRIVVSDAGIGRQLWLIDTGTSTPTQFTFSPGGKAAPLWSPDGQWIAFFVFADGSIRRKRSNGAGDEETLFPRSSPGLSDWSPDGRTILVSDGGSPNANIDVLPLEGKRESRPYLANPAYMETRGVFSPNGRWVAYESNESGRFEIYVRPFPDPSGGQSKVSTDGGKFARWSADGRELYYLAPAGTLMAVPVTIAADVFTHGAAKELFRTRIAATEMADVVHPYDVSADGRFLMRVPGDEEDGPITVLLNWSPEKK